MSEDTKVLLTEAPLAVDLEEVEEDNEEEKEEESE